MNPTTYSQLWRKKIRVERAGPEARTVERCIQIIERNSEQYRIDGWEQIADALSHQADVLRREFGLDPQEPPPTPERGA